MVSIISKGQNSVIQGEYQGHLSYIQVPKGVFAYVHNTVHNMPSYTLLGPNEQHILDGEENIYSIKIFYVNDTDRGLAAQTPYGSYKFYVGDMAISDVVTKGRDLSLNTYEELHTIYIYKGYAAIFYRDGQEAGYIIPGYWKSAKSPYPLDGYSIDFKNKTIATPFGNQPFGDFDRIKFVKLDDNPSPSKAEEFSPNKQTTYQSYWLIIIVMIILSIIILVQIYGDYNHTREEVD